MQLTFSGFRDGLWSGTLSTEREQLAPALKVVDAKGGERDVEVAPRHGRPGVFDVSFRVNIADVAQGVSTFLICDAADGQVLDRFVMMAGAPADQDLVAELALLRAELDLLKSVVRGHVRDTS